MTLKKNKMNLGNYRKFMVQVEGRRMTEFQCSKCGKTQKEGTQIIGFTEDGGAICESCMARCGRLSPSLLRARRVRRIFKPQFVV
ncbi:MAG: hypothetical protein ACXABF_16460 [Candidatus Thorarchaeota archaeon]